MNVEDYKKMLEKARKSLPKEILETVRFEIPSVKGHIQGNRTIISNFNQVASALHRTPEHLLKFLLKELATPGELKTTGLILGRKISADQINEKIKKYVEEFVICKACKKPDTKLMTENNVISMKCLVCGAKHPVRG